MLPAPIVLPKDHCPVCAPIVVRLFTGAWAPCPFVPTLDATVLAGPPLVAALVEPGMSELYRELLGLELLRCVLRAVSVLIAWGGSV